MIVQHPAKKPWSRPLGDLLGAAIHPALAKQGFGEAGLILHWEDIAGPRISRFSEPEKLQWPPRPPKTSPDKLPEPATLVLRVEGAFAIELQHLAPVLVERVNAHFGWACIGRIALRQGPLQRKAAKAKIKPVGPLAKMRAAAVVGEGGDEALRAALLRLGGRVLDGRG